MVRDGGRRLGVAGVNQVEQLHCSGAGWIETLSRFPELSALLGAVAVRRLSKPFQLFPSFFMFAFLSIYVFSYSFLYS